MYVLNKVETTYFYIFVFIITQRHNTMKKRDTCRTLLDLTPYGIYIFDEIGRYNYDHVQPTLPEHTHPGMLEFCFLAKGHQTYYIGPNSYHLYGGNVFFTKPDELHGTGEFPEEKGLLYWIVIKSPDMVCDFLNLKQEEAHLIFKRLCNLPQRIFSASAMLEQLFKEIFEKRKQNTLLTGIEMRSLTTLLLLELIRLGEIKESKEQSIAIQKIIDYINGHLKEDIDLEELAEMINLSLSRFKHRFKEEVGIPPAEFITRKKIELAEIMLLKRNYNIKDIAYDLGFSSPAHFSNVFKQYKGNSPQVFKEKTMEPLKTPLPK